jgi:acyl-CoA synthetase (AMP-forming)/AMP-acid ligase II
VTRLNEEPHLREATSGATRTLIWIEVDAIARQEQLPLPIPVPSATTLALFQYTSGSTTAPKGVMVSHANLIANSGMIATAFGHDESSRGVCWLILFHDMGLVGHVLQPLYSCGLSVLMSPLTFLQRPARWLKAVSNCKATTSGGPSYAFELCLKLVRDEELENLDL